jgi:hypothetical protein
MAGPESDYFRVKAKWKGNELYWLPPYGNWTSIATFVNGRFQRRWDDIEILWVYECAGPDELAEDEKPLLTLKEPHDYAITPSGERKPGWNGEED